MMTFQQFLDLVRAEVITSAWIEELAAATSKDQKLDGPSERNDATDGNPPAFDGRTEDSCPQNLSSLQPYPPGNERTVGVGRSGAVTYERAIRPYSLITHFQRLYDTVKYEPESVSLAQVSRRISASSYSSHSSRTSRHTVDSGFYSATSSSNLRAGGNNSTVCKSSSLRKEYKEPGNERNPPAQSSHRENLKERERIEKMCLEWGCQVEQECETVPALQSECHAKTDQESEDKDVEIEIASESGKELISEEVTHISSAPRTTKSRANEVDVGSEDDQAHTVPNEGIGINATEQCTHDTQNEASSSSILRPLLPPLDRKVMTLTWLEGDGRAVEPHLDLLPTSLRPPSHSSNPQAEIDGESFSWSDDGEPDSAEVSDDHTLYPFRSALALHLFSKFQICATGPGDGGSATAQGSGSLHRKSSSSGSSQEVRGAKRKKSNGSSDDNEEHRSHRQKVSYPSEGADEKLLACPFCKHNPRRYRDCYKYILRDVSRLKQHLARRHRIPSHCPSCSQEFESELERDQHIRSRSCEVLPPRRWNGIDETQKRQLERRISTKKTKEENWYIIYEILFPDAIRPRSPYVDAPLSEELLTLQEFTLTEGPSIVSEFTRTELPETLRPHEQEVQTFLEIMFQDAVGLLLERYATSLPARLENSNNSRLSMAQSNSSDSGYTSNDADANNEISQDVGGSAALPVQDADANHQSDLPMNIPDSELFNRPLWNPLFATGLTEMEYNLELLLNNYDGSGNLFGQQE